MILVLLGAFHFIHCPTLILFPCMTSHRSTDICYLLYFFELMYIYTFIHGECPISYVAKLTIDPNYIAGSNVTHYPEMATIFREPKYTVRYFETMTVIYIVSLCVVLYRANVPLYLVTVPAGTLPVYFWYIRQGYNKGYGYMAVRELARISILFSMKGLIGLL